jgi:hypothetical protein
MTCVICNQFSDEPLCDSCRLLVEQSTFRHRFSSPARLWRPVRIQHILPLVL